jgi:hypothetical protein
MPDLADDDPRPIRVVLGDREAVGAHERMFAYRRRVDDSPAGLSCPPACNRRAAHLGDDEDTEGQLLLVINSGNRLVVSGVINEIQANLVALDNCKVIDGARAAIVMPSVLEADEIRGLLLDRSGCDRHGPRPCQRAPRASRGLSGRRAA